VEYSLPLPAAEPSDDSEDMRTDAWAVGDPGGVSLNLFLSGQSGTYSSTEPEDASREGSYSLPDWSMALSAALMILLVFFMFCRAYGVNFIIPCPLPREDSPLPDCLPPLPRDFTIVLKQHLVMLC